MTSPHTPRKTTAIGKGHMEGNTDQKTIDRELRLAELEKAEHKAIEYERYKFLKRVDDLNKRHKIVFITHVNLRINHPMPTHLLKPWQRWFVAFMKWLRGKPKVEEQFTDLNEGKDNPTIKKLDHESRK